MSCYATLTPRDMLAFQTRSIPVTQTHLTIAMRAYPHQDLEVYVSPQVPPHNPTGMYFRENQTKLCNGHIFHLLVQGSLFSWVHADTSVFIIRHSDHHLKHPLPLSQRFFHTHQRIRYCFLLIISIFDNNRVLTVRLPLSRNKII